MQRIAPVVDDHHQDLFIFALFYFLYLLLEFLKFFLRDFIRLVLHLYNSKYFGYVELHHILHTVPQCYYRTRAICARTLHLQFYNTLLKTLRTR